MHSRPALAVVGIAAIAAALLIAPSSASAASGSFTNPLTSGSATTFDISSVDVVYNTSTVTVTAHTQNFVPPAWNAEVVILDGPLTSSTGRAYDVKATAASGSIGSITTSANATAGQTSATPVSGADVSITKSAANNTVTATIPSSHVFWQGPIFVGVLIHDNSNAMALAAVSQTPAVVGLGPVLQAPDPTTTSVALTYAHQVHGSTPASAIVTVSPATAGVITLREGTTVIATSNTSDGNAVVTLPTTLASGIHTLQAQFVPTDVLNYASATSTPVSFTVISAAISTKTTAILSKKSQIYKKSSARVTIAVSGKPSGKVTVYDGKKKLKTLTIKKGKASYTFSKKLKKGTHKIKVVYVPADKEAFKTSTSKTLVLKVTK